MLIWLYRSLTEQVDLEPSSRLVVSLEDKSEVLSNWHFNQIKQSEMNFTRQESILLLHFLDKELYYLVTKLVYPKPSGFDRINVRRLFITLEKGGDQHMD